MKKFLIIQTAFIGDAILASAVLEHFHKHMPEAKLDILVRAGNESLFDHHPFIQRVLVWDKKNEKYRGLLRLLKLIRSEQYEGVLNLQRYAASAFLTAFSGARKTAGFASSWLSLFFTDRVQHRIGDKSDVNYLHEVDRCIRVTRTWLPIEKGKPALYPSEADQKSILQYCSQPFITISPSSVWFTKQTPLSVWKELMQNSAQYRIYLLGGLSDADSCHELAASFSNAEVLAGKLSFLQSAALMKCALMNYTNDSAPLHLCSATNAPVTAVFCSTIPEFGFGPLSDKASVVQSRLDLKCKPCGIHGHASCPRGHFDCGKISIGDLTDTLP